jgi:hypothetical protein
MQASAVRMVNDGKHVDILIRVKGTLVPLDKLAFRRRTTCRPRSGLAPENGGCVRGAGSAATAETSCRESSLGDNPQKGGVAGATDLCDHLADGRPDPRRTFAKRGLKTPASLASLFAASPLWVDEPQSALGRRADSAFLVDEGEGEILDGIRIADCA